MGGFDLSQTIIRIILWLSLPLLFSCGRAYDQDVQCIESQTTIFVDESNALTIDDITTPEILSQFKKEKLNRGVLSHNTWVKIELPKDITSKYWYFEVARSKVQIEQVFEWSNNNFTKASLLPNISRNIYTLSDTSDLLLIKATNIGIPASFYFQLYQNEAALYQTTSKDLLSLSLITLLIFLSMIVVVVMYFNYKDLFYPYYFLILVCYLLFFSYDQGFGKLFLSVPATNFTGQLPNMMYLSLLLPLFLTIGLPILEKHKTWVYGVAVLNILLIVFMIKYFLAISGIFLVYNAILGSWLLIGLIIYSYKDWFYNAKHRVFVLGFFWLLSMPNLKGAQNAGLAEGGLYESSFAVFLIFELVTWSLFIILKIRDVQRQKLVLVKEQQVLQVQLSHDLLKGQEKERNTIALRLKEDVSPQLNALKLLIDQSAKKSIEKLDNIIENIRYLSRIYIAPDLRKNKLETVLRRFIALIQSIKPIRIILEYELDEGKAPDYYLLVNIYRLVQEAINNSLIHGQSNTIIVQILGDTKLTVINIEDNGKLKVEQIEEGQGIKGIRSRLSDYHYSMKLSNQPNQGARLEIEIKNLQSA